MEETSCSLATMLTELLLRTGGAEKFDVEEKLLVGRLARLLPTAVESYGNSIITTVLPTVFA